MPGVSGPPEPPEPPEQEAGGPVSQPSADEREAITWEYDIPLINNLFMVRDFLLVLVLSLVIMQALVIVVGFLAGEELVVIPLQIYGIVIAVLVVLFLVAAGIVFANRHRTRFTVSRKGVDYETGARERRINRVVLFLSFLVGRPGAALLATSREAGHFDWADVHKVSVFPRKRVITLSDSWHPLLRLYCPPESFDQTVAAVQGYAAAAAAKRAARQAAEPAARTRRPWWFYAAWIVGVGAATFLGLAGYDTRLDDAWRWLILASVFVLVAGLLNGALGRRFFGLLGMLVGIFVLIYLLKDAFRPIIGPSGMSYGRAYEVDTWVFVVSLIGQLSLIAMGGWRLLGKDRHPATDRRE